MVGVPETMRAVDPETFGGPEVLALVERPVPVPAADEVLIRVAAAGVNRPDVLQRMGFYPPPPGAPSIPGLEVSGEIVAAGGEVPHELIGQPVCALLEAEIARSKTRIERAVNHRASADALFKR